MSRISEQRGAAGKPGGSSLALLGLEFRYPRASGPAVDGIDLDAEAGQMLTLLGPSGCGKTTTLRMIAGLMQPTGGQVLIDGKDITRVPVHARNMGMVFQDYALFPHLSVSQNVAFGLDMRKVPADEKRRRVGEALERVGLGDYAGRSVAALSGGQRQRVALARALAVQPSILLLDEPLSNLDATLRSSLRDEIRELQLRTGTTAVFVTHDQQEALAVSDRIAVLNAGRVEQLGSPSDIFNHPSTRFVASFIGRANVLDGAVLWTESGVAAVEVPGIGIVRALLDPEAPRPGSGTRTAVAVHPHRVRIEEEATGPGIVSRSVFTGTTVQQDVVVGDVTLRVEHLTGHDLPVPAAGARVRIGWEAQDAWVIPA